MLVALRAVGDCGDTVTGVDVDVGFVKMLVLVVDTKLLVEMLFFCIE